YRIAANASRDAVSNAVVLSTHGDTVIIPAGTSVWVNGIVVSNNIRIIGEEPTPAGPRTMIIDECPKPPEDPLFTFETSTNNGYAELAWIYFEGPTTNANPPSAEKFLGRIRWNGTAQTNNRIHHCVLNNFNGVGIFVKDFNFPCIDHLGIYGGNSHPVAVEYDSWQPFNGATNQEAQPYNQAHGSWADDPYWGSYRFTFVESCTISNNAGFDAFGGARDVIRFNTITNTASVMHGTEGQGRGAKQREEYGNTFFSTSSQPIGQIRSGTIITASNTYTGSWTAGRQLVVYRFTRPEATSW